VLPGVTVRPAGPGDLARVRELVRAAGLPLDGLDEAALVLVAEREGRVVGTTSLEAHGPALLLRSAAVDPASRGSGVGTALTRAALAHADALGAPVALLTRTAEQWYPRFGFSVVGRSELPPALHASAELRGACPASAVAMLRPVP
jgi:amino-acid N-acetyltransferase